MTRRILAVLISVTLAVIGTAAVFLYVRSADARAQAGKQARTVVVAVKPIPAGTSGKALKAGGYLRTETMPAQTVPQEALTAVSADLDTLVVTADVQAGQLLLRPMFGQSTDSTAGLRVPDGKVAVAVTVKPETFGPGLIRAGATVAVFWTYTPIDDSHRDVAAGDGLEKGRTVNSVTRLLLNDVAVLSVIPLSNNQSTATTSQSSTPTYSDNAVITLAVSQSEAEKLAHANALGGELNVALLSDGSNVKPDGGVDNRSLFG